MVNSYRQIISASCLLLRSVCGLNTSSWTSVSFQSPCQFVLRTLIRSNIAGINAGPCLFEQKHSRCLQVGGVEL